MRRRWIHLLVILHAISAPVPAQFATAPVTPATEPSTRGASAQPAIDRLALALGAVGLSDEQRPKVDALLNDLRRQLGDVPDLAPEDRRDTLRQVMGDGRRRLGEILTPDQLRALRDRQQVPVTEGRPAAPALPLPPPPPPAVAPDVAPGQAEVPDGKFTGAIGARVPEFALRRVPSGVVRSAAHANRVLVIEFGSYSVPTFRHRSAAMDALARDYAGRAEFITVYTAEGYPAGEWDVSRNRDDDVAVPRHADEPARLAAAEQARAVLKPNRVLAIDTMTDPLAAQFRAGAHSAFVVARDGTIVARQQWCDPDGLRRHLDAAIAVRVQPRP